jgi:hypothetical protein
LELSENKLGDVVHERRSLFVVVFNYDICYTKLQYFYKIGVSGIGKTIHVNYNSMGPPWQWENPKYTYEMFKHEPCQDT